VPLGLLTAFMSFGAGQTVLSGLDSPHASFGQPHVLRAVIGAGCYLAVVGLFGVALGVLIRHTVGGVVAVLLITSVIPTLLGIVPGSAGGWLTKVWPITAGSQIMAVQRGVDALGPWSGFAVLCLSAVALLAVSSAVLRMRDA
jgi:hypothetical protein